MFLGLRLNETGWKRRQLDDAKAPTKSGTVSLRKSFHPYFRFFGPLNELYEV
jgi:hypothetical protein